MRMVIAGLWLGGLAAVGGIGAPTAFSVVPEKMLAAAVASTMFYKMALVGLVCGAVLLMLERRHARSIAASTPLLLVLGGLLADVLCEFGVVPRLLQAAVTRAPNAGMWHVAASATFLLELACVLAYVWLLGARPDPHGVDAPGGSGDSAESDFLDA